ncbi:MAG: hypothetical protein ABIP06_10935 [Pyrinomonadaceae bacterium]
MNKTFLLLTLILSAFVFSASAQDDFSSRRLNDLVYNLKRQTVDLVDRTSEDLRRGTNNSRSDIEAAFLAHQLDASVGLFDQMVRDNRRAAELRDAAAIISELVRRAPGYGTNSNLWRNAQTSINDINRELGGSGGGNTGGGNPVDEKPVIGRAYWRGTVDDRVRIKIQGKELFFETVSGRTYPDGTYSFTAPMPSKNVSLGVIKKNGRGDVSVIQQPNSANNYIGIIEIRDSSGGARDYELEIFWK